MENLVTPLAETINSRAKNPIIGSFSAAWLIHNFDAWAQLIFDSSITLNHRLAHFFAYGSTWHFLWAPLLYGALIYIITVALSRLTGLISIIQQEYFSERGVKLAEKENYRLKVQNEGAAYKELLQDNHELWRLHSKFSARINELKGVENEIKKVISNTNENAKQKFEREGSMYHRNISTDITKNGLDRLNDKTITRVDQNVSNIRNEALRQLLFDTGNLNSFFAGYNGLIKELNDLVIKKGVTNQKYED